MVFDRVWQSIADFGVPLGGCWPATGGSLAAFVAIAAAVVGGCFAAG